MECPQCHDDNWLYNRWDGDPYQCQSCKHRWGGTFLRRFVVRFQVWCWANIGWNVLLGGAIAAIVTGSWLILFVAAVAVFAVKLSWACEGLVNLAEEHQSIESKLDKVHKQQMILVDLITRLVKALEKKDE